MRDLRVVTLENPPPVFECSGGCGQLVDSSGVYYVDTSGSIFCAFCRALFELGAHRNHPNYVIYH